VGKKTRGGVKDGESKRVVKNRGFQRNVLGRDFGRQYKGQAVCRIQKGRALAVMRSKDRSGKRGAGSREEGWGKATGKVIETAPRNRGPTELASVTRDRREDDTQRARRGQIGERPGGASVEQERS